MIADNYVLSDFMLGVDTTCISYIKRVVFILKCNVLNIRVVNDYLDKKTRISEANNLYKHLIYFQSYRH